MSMPSLGKAVTGVSVRLTLEGGLVPVHRTRDVNIT